MYVGIQSIDADIKNIYILLYIFNNKNGGEHYAKL
ncbi:MAG: hypothetical protein K0R15_178 [Clostridiales bacterium]|jgi:hypothetical protein|nr:hypothetical protein [Clostridiales bacterium]